MNLQIIKSVKGKDEYVLLPVQVYHALRDQIQARMRQVENKADYVPFDPADYVDNPIALARIKAGLTQAALAAKMGVSQAYISKIEAQEQVTVKLLQKVKKVLER